ncbi:MAG: J domain-containing protein [Clostridia bacterium]
MKTLYELLEVSETASKEIIEKAYKVLAKKYHPDLQKEEDKEKAEQKMKQINEAYDILSDDTKRAKYDEELKFKRQQEEIQKNQAQNSQTQNNQTIATNNYNQNYNQEQTQEELEKMRQKINEMQNQYQQKYQQAYEGYLKSLGYKIKYKWTWDRFKDLLKTILIMGIIILAIWFFPPTHKILVDFYESNTIIKTIVDVIAKIFVGIWNSILSFF